MHTGKSLFGAMQYNYSKVEGGHACILGADNCFLGADGQPTRSSIMASFKSNISLNNRIEKPVFTISLNPHPDDTKYLSDADYITIAREYMDKMGYGSQPYVIVKHNDIKREHIHIVSIRVDGTGKKVEYGWEKCKSSRIRQDIERRYGLRAASAILSREEIRENSLEFLQQQKVNLRDVDAPFLETMRNALRFSLQYKVTTMAEYQKVLSRLGVGIHEVTTDKGKGLVYFAIDDKGNRISDSIKGSRMGKAFSYPGVTKRMAEAKNNKEVAWQKNKMQKDIRYILSQKAVISYLDFIKEMQSRGYDVDFAKNDSGRIFGVTFTDYESGFVFKGSELGKEFSMSTLKEKIIQEGMGETVTYKEVYLLQKDLQHYYNTMRKSGEYFFESTLIDNFSAKRAEMVDYLIALHPQMPSAIILAGVDKYTARKVNDYTKIREKEKAFFVENALVYIKYAVENIESPTERTAFLQSLDINPEILASGRIRFTHRQDENIAIWDTHVGVKKEMFERNENKTTRLNKADKTILQAIIQGDISTLHFEKINQYAEILKYLPEDKRIEVLKKMTTDEIKHRYNNGSSIENSISKLLEKGFVIRPVIKKDGTNDYYIGYVGLKENTYIKVSDTIKQQLNECNYSRKFTSIRELVYTKGGYASARYRLLVSISRAEEIKDKNLARKMLISRITAVKDMQEDVKGELLKELNKENFDMQRLADIVKAGDKNLKTNNQTKKGYKL